MKLCRSHSGLLWLLALSGSFFTLACSGSGGGGGGEFQIESINLVNNAIWQINRPITVRFTQPVDFNSVNLNTINVRQLGGAPSAGEFFLQDANTVVFQPLCPRLDDLSDSGLKPGGVKYELNVLGDDKKAPSTVRSLSGESLARSQTREFTTPVSLLASDLFFDTKVGPPLPVVRTDLAGDDTQFATYIELGGDPNNRSYFERNPISGAITLDPPLELQLNKYSDPSSQVALVLQFNQPVDPSSSNISTRRIQWQFRQSGGAWDNLETDVTLVNNCTQAGATVRFDPVGLMPPDTTLRAVVTTEFKDIVGDENPLAQDFFAIADTEPAPAPLGDNVLDDFTTNANEDSTAPFAEPHAVIQDGQLQAAFSFTGTGGPGGFFDWKVSTGEIFIFNTSNATVTGGPNFTPTTTVTMVGGVVDVRNLWIQQGGLLLVQGPNPMKILASGTVLIEGEIDLSGTVSPGVATLNTTNIPEPGAPGQAGGGKGGTGSPLVTASSPKGGDGFGAFNVPDAGGIGGETGWAPGSQVDKRRGAGGGGGTFGHNQPNPTTGAGLYDQSFLGLDAEDGFNNEGADFGALSPSPGPAHGGLAGLSPFADTDTTNDFYGTMFDILNNKLVIGELKTPWAGAGGGGGGDVSQVKKGSFPEQPFDPKGDEKGAGGGGGGGSLQILALKDVTFGPLGIIRCRGGFGGGGENTLFLNRVGGGSGGGSGGHVIIQTAGIIDLSLAQSVNSTDQAILATGGQGGAGAGDKGGAFPGANGQKETTIGQDACPPGYGASNQTNGCKGHVDGAGGDGGPGLIQLHTSTGLVGTPGSGATIVVPIGKSLAKICKPTPLCPQVSGVADCFLVPTFGRTSRARSLWIPLGEGGFQSSSSVYKDVIFEFGGVDPVTGLVQVDPVSGDVAAPPPLLGPEVVTSPALPDIDPTNDHVLLMDATSLVGGPNELYLTDPELLVHDMVELSQTSAPTNFQRFDIVSASLDALSLTPLLRLEVDAAGPPLTSFAPGGSVSAALVPAYFRILTATTADALPPSATVQIQFEATAADANGLPVVPATRPLTSDISTLNLAPNGTLRFVRFEVLFDIDAQGTGLDPSNPIPGLDYLRIPFRYQ